MTEDFKTQNNKQRYARYAKTTRKEKFTQLQLTRETVNNLREISKQLNKPMSVIVTEIVNKYLGKNPDGIFLNINENTTIFPKDKKTLEIDAEV